MHSPKYITLSSHRAVSPPPTISPGFRSTFNLNTLTYVVPLPSAALWPSPQDSEYHTRLG